MTKYSIIVPAYHEQANITPLTKRLFAALNQTDCPIKESAVELIIVDDNSQDGSEQAVKQLAEHYNVRIIVRKSERGLASAVVTGFKQAKGEYLLCMDADLQHPPETAPLLLHALESTPFVIGSRYVGGGKVDENWPLYRRIISTGSRYLALPLTSASDPMSGFFGIQKQRFNMAIKQGINPSSFKIALDLLVKGNIRRSEIAELAFNFGTREEGESKLTGKVAIKYLEQLYELYHFVYGNMLYLVMLLVVILGMVVSYELASVVLDI